MIGSANGQLYHLIHVDDLTEIFLMAAIHPVASGGVFIAGDPAALTLADIVQIIGAEIGRSKPVRPDSRLALFHARRIMRGRMPAPGYRSASVPAKGGVFHQRPVFQYSAPS